MERLQEFQTATREGSFVVVSESGEGTVQWLRKKMSGTVRDTHQHMCIDSFTNSVTIYWMTAPREVKRRRFLASLPWKNGSSKYRKQLCSDEDGGGPFFQS